MAAGRALPPLLPPIPACESLPDIGMVCQGCGEVMAFECEKVHVPGYGNLHASCYADPDLRLRLYREGFLTEDDLGA
jgi:hypothetical protein